MMFKACVIGASGYTGAELAKLIEDHPHFELAGVFVSPSSQDAHKPISALHPWLQDYVEQTLIPISDEKLAELADSMDAIFLATPHEASHDWGAQLTLSHAKVFDLSGAFRIKDTAIFEQFYGFKHAHTDLLDKAVYGLAEWYADEISTANFVAVPGCYPTASLLALKPLTQAGMADDSMPPIINAVSGVSGAGRKAALNNSFCEVSLQAYGVLGHRHQPEISQYLGDNVVFTPHLGDFKRGILATITLRLKKGTTENHISEAYQQAYSQTPLVRLMDNFPKLDDVVRTPFCDIAWKYDALSGILVVGSAIDNLLKGAASQALQCANLAFGFEGHTSLSKSSVTKGAQM